LPGVRDASAREKFPPVSLLSARNVSKVFLYQVDESSDAPLLYAINDGDVFLMKQWTPRFQ
jgi:hypothetical protein